MSHQVPSLDARHRNVRGAEGKLLSQAQARIVPAIPWLEGWGDGAIGMQLSRRERCRRMGPTMRSRERIRRLC
ncbi:hypothetical protein FIBSPDRAFT_875499 [Athelia psychrophila]|uniref:Uncharacterized protein n=1 Tax=Athelia psychrophila TaxID=1759441 RepID=A0A167XNF8_9AGAM|nr:hypothetical protein FIBSPDRAFT_875499 [Fibularhizoctonia sp. CBS 109695]